MLIPKEPANMTICINRADLKAPTFLDINVMTTASKIDNEDYFKTLKKRPFVAWPTVVLLLCSLSTIALVWYMVTQDIIPLWSGCLINIIAYYYLFSPIHDGAHRSISNDDKINDFIMSLAFIPVSVIMGGVPWARMFHMQHHRHTGKKDLDPDIEISSKGRHALSRWFFWGFHYREYFKQYKDQLPSIKTQAFNRTRVSVSMAFFAFLLWNFPLEFIFLWVVPLYAGISWMTAFVFSYLPHHVHQRDPNRDPLNDYEATCNIVGFEWLLSPLSQYQNYHLVHHLYPTVPFYRYVKIWNARQSYHLSEHPSEIRLGKTA